ncbi:hypothetical protein B0E54_01936 [Micromonospora sp. MH99]|nr:hypothetical protein [Micromonospora sp. MH99]
MIILSHGNLLNAEADGLVNPVNTVGVMGKGIALQFKRAHPANYAAYRTACRERRVELGRMFIFDSGRPGPQRYVINFPTKGHWRTDSKLDDIEAGLADLVHVVDEKKINSVAIPALGCGNGGLNWNDVKPLIKSAFATIPEVRILLFPPEWAPGEVDGRPRGHR